VLYPCWNAEPKAEAMMANNSLPLRLCNKEEKSVGLCCSGCGGISAVISDRSPEME